MNLPNTAQSKTNEIIAVMSSYDFFEQLMLKNDFTIELMAGYGWDEENNKVMIDERIYDVDEEKWLVENYNQKLISQLCNQPLKYLSKSLRSNMIRFFIYYRLC